MVKIEVDSHKLIYHPKRVAKWLEDGDCFPIYTEIGLTNRCNHRCKFCALDYLEYTGVDIDKEVILSALKDMAENGVKSVMFAGEGEPFLHKDFCDLVIKAKEYGLDISITTNGVLFNKEKAEKILSCLSWVRFSLDAGSKENYSKIHGTRAEDFEKVIQNIRDISKIKKEKNLKTTIGVQFLLISDNVNELTAAIKLVKEAGADNIQIKPYSHHPLSKNDLSVDYSKLNWLEEEIKSLKDDNFQISYRKKAMQSLSEERDYKECHGLPFFTLIDAKGNVLPCNLFYGSQDLSYGNLYKNSFSEIWKSKRRKEVLKKLKEKGVVECRGACRLNPINQYLFQLKNPHPHQNFI